MSNLVCSGKKSEIMTKYAICEQSLVAVRKQPSDQSEMINQLLFGDLLAVTDNKNSWCLIITKHDGYEGWVDIKQITIIDKIQFDELARVEPVFLSDISATFTSTEGKMKHIVIGSKLPYFKNNSFLISDGKYMLDGGGQTSIANKPPNIIENAMKFIGAPYLWGGRSPFGIDCSGLSQIVFGMSGIKLKRDASLQVEIGETINFMNEAVAGDLAFFDNEEGIITHVGIIVDNKQIIHASGEVRIDSIDHNGIYNKQQKKYTHKLRIIKRIVGA